MPNPWDNDQIVQPQGSSGAGQVFTLPTSPKQAVETNRTVVQTRGDQIDNSVKGATAPAVVRKTNAEATAAEHAAMVTPGQKALDEAFAKDYADWRAGGGYTAVDRQLRTLAEQRARLSKSGDISGPIVGSIPDFINKWINPEAIDVRQNIEQSIQGALRPTLGAQFTQAEGDRMIQRGYNPGLDEAANIQRLNSAINELRSRAQVKDDAAQYFEQHGTLAGWKGGKPNGSNAPLTPQRVASNALRREYESYTAQTKNLPALARQAGLKKLQEDPRMKRLWGIVNSGQRGQQQPQSKFLGWED